MNNSKENLIIELPKFSILEIINEQRVNIEKKVFRFKSSSQLNRVLNENEQKYSEYKYVQFKM
jgi:hypothetical protein